MSCKYSLQTLFITPKAGTVLSAVSSVLSEFEDVLGLGFLWRCGKNHIDVDTLS